ncbi:hypothetical protein MJ_0890 [Methanocaldococcus jannaschii DSM 2661]|uniref:UPF0148 protein MJ0890 n=2 Tax=Methanocaldococcus jannaschii TaxID=2190 RepID=Y890_METJA|nr:RecName: Full=UPF0148 protein MJ0890 [Methanocaldococcus jannaschii DSM 2661]AAB98906.1 hypothetical protein MJ_0890 [Methanocaldococcus jannaschii DSM 2661]
MIKTVIDNLCYNFGENMKNDDAIKVLSNELLKGAKMLSTHCSKCGCPLFEKDGKIYCPICEKLKNKETIEKGENEKEIKNEIERKKSEINEILDLNKVVMDKINYLVMKLKEEDEVSRIREIAEAIYVLIKLKKKIE